MKFSLIVGACLLAALPSVLGHAALVNPVAFNSQPSKTFPSGGVGSGPLNIIPVGGTVSWKLIAGDGAGPIRMLIDPAGVTSNFPTSYAATPAASLITVDLNSGQNNVVGTTYDYPFTLPAGLTCTGTVGVNTAVCTVQISSSSNWVAAFSFTKQAPPAGSSTGAVQQQTVSGSCVTVATPLTTCTYVTGQTIFVATGADTTSMDQGVAATLTQNLPNVNVFYNQPQSPSVTTPCTEAYKRFLCAQTFTPCANNQPITTTFQDQPCASTCNEFTCWCDLNPLHAGLYRCSDYVNANRDSTGRCGFKFGPNNSTCVPTIRSSTGANCVNGVCSAAPSAATLQPLVLAVLAIVSILAVVYHN